MKSMTRWIAGLALASTLAFAAQAATDPFLGTWRLDKSKSLIAKDPGVKSKSFDFAPSKDGVMITETLEMLSENGVKHVTHLPYAYGKATPQPGPGMDAFTVTKTDSHTALWTASLKGQILSRLEVHVSADGKQMAFRYLGAAKDPTGAITKDRYVYVKQ
jgi:hypothetical protein